MSATLSARLQGPWYAVDSTSRTRLWLELPENCHSAFLAHEEFFGAVAAGSNYLCDLMLRHAEDVSQWLGSAPEAILANLCAEIDHAGRHPDPEETGRLLRHIKPRLALLVALCDIGRTWTLEEVTSALTRFADLAVNAVVDSLLRESHAKGRLLSFEKEQPGKGSGYVVLAMGKHGAAELNYSSDTDLVVLYDPDAAALAPGIEPSTFYVKVTQRLASLLQDVTVDGYVLRVDLRLRPDPRATQVAIAIESAATYYENMGQNWERAAYIKARAIAGDIALGEEFQQRLVPYIWRKYLDFASIADVQSLIRQIHAVKGHGEIAVEGHNLKLGRGGIREIEFFVQTQQLIAGGRNPALRGKRTIETLDALAAANWITDDTAEDLKRCYRLLRTFEHRSQMQDDRQTHIVPEESSAFERYAKFCGYPDAALCHEALRSILETVRGHSAQLFERSNELGGERGSLVFTGGDDDPETIMTLERMGFRQASEVSATIRGWHFGRYAATRDRRAKEALTELMPKLLSALSRTGDADRAFITFDQFLKGLPAGVQLFAMLRANPGLLDLLAQILGTAPRLAKGLSDRPRVLEAVLDPTFFGPLPDLTSLKAALLSMAPQDLGLDEVMDRVRVFGREQLFRVGVRVLSETVTAEDAGRGFANVADAAIARLLAATEDDMARNYGRIPGGNVAVVALGKLGGREMTAASDLDLMIIYDHAIDADASDGQKPLSVTQYYARLAQRLITAISVPTSEGGLYEVDMRLRPSGSQGPVAVSLSAFKCYQRGSAWTWEKLALTRARVVAGAAEFSEKLNTAIKLALCAPRDVEKTKADVLAMRGLMLREHKPSSCWDIKRVRGGLVEAEFIAQYLQLIHAPHQTSVLATNTLEAFGRLRAAHLITATDADAVVEACQLFHRLTQVLRLCLAGEYAPESALPGLNQAVALAAGTPDVRGAEDLLQQNQRLVACLFDRLIGKPEYFANEATESRGFTV
jgi:[glutamine synthetase] adenylyltransferase / [glutamine synthetase]-adenylyl-L-tyrosine phosphorylase